MNESRLTTPGPGLARVLHRLGAAWNAAPDRNGAILLCALAAFWSLDQVVPTFDQIGHHDDMAYIRSGHWLMAHGDLRVLAWGPLLSLVYGLAYALVQESPNWFVLTAAGGRLGILALFCGGVYLCARTLGLRGPGYAALVIGLTWPIATSFFGVWNSGDILFIALSALALSQLLEYVDRSSSRHLVWGSVCVGFAALTRPDGFILCVSFVALAYATYARGRRALVPSGWPRAMLAAVLPAVLLVGGYVVLRAAVTGSWSTGTMFRTYTAFEQGYGVIFSERYRGIAGPAMALGYDDVRALFGTRQDNDSSVFRAIISNPPAFLERVAQSLLQLPERIFRIFGKPLTVVLLFLAGRGALSLWRTRERWTLVVLLGWHLHMLSYFLTFWRPGYIRFAFVALALLGGIGATAIARGWQDRRERAAVAVVVGGLVAWLAWDGAGSMWGDPAAKIFPVTVVLLLALGLFLPTLAPACRRRRDGKLLSLLAGAAMVSAVAVAAGRSPASHFPLRVGESPEERAVAAAAAIVPPGIPIAGQGGRLQAAARRPSYAAGAMMSTVSSAAAFEQWLAGSTAGAIYLNPFLRRVFKPGNFNLLLEHLQRHPNWLPVFSEPAAHIHLFVRDTVLQVRDVWRSHEPALRSEFDVYVLDGLLVFVKKDCSDEDASRRFLLFVYPTDVTVLPERQRVHRRTTRHFDGQVMRVDDRCVVATTLPTYEIDAVLTGQYKPSVIRYWQDRIEFRGDSAVADPNEAG